MKTFWEGIRAWLKNPSVLVICVNWLLTVAAATGAIVMAATGYSGAFCYVVYAIAALSLAYSVYTVVKFAPTVKRGVQNKLKKYAFTRKMTENYGFRTLVFAWASAGINLAFVAFNLVMGILTKNAWYASLAGYYFLLSGLRGGVFLLDKRAKKLANGEEAMYRKAQIKNYGLCGLALFVLEVAMAVAVTFMVVAGKPTKYTEIMAIVFATYSVYKIALAIRNIFKAKKNKDWQVQAFRNIGLVDAAISLLSLQTTLVATFSEDGWGMYALNAIVGLFVCLFTIGVGAAMIVQSRRRIGERNGEI